MPPPAATLFPARNAVTDEETRVAATPCTGTTATGRPCRNKVVNAGESCGRCGGSRPSASVAAGLPPSPTTVAATDPLAGSNLSPSDTATLDFERSWWQHGKERADAYAALGVDPDEHAAALDRLLDDPNAEQYDRMLVVRLRRVRDRLRASHGMPSSQEDRP